jgi:hypothetical protein
VPWYDDWLELDVVWFMVDEHEQNLTMFHEITHGQDTVDITDDPFNDANSLEKLMYVDFVDWSPYFLLKRNALRNCPGGGTGGGNACTGR